MYTYSPLQTLVQVVFSVLWSSIGYISIDALEYNNGGYLFVFALTMCIIAMSAQITLLINQIVYNHNQGY